MAKATPIRNGPQGDYRLREECSTDTARAHDAPVEYRLTAGITHPIERIGSGWTVFDRTPGAPMAPDELDEMRAVMVGADPRTGERVISKPKTAVATAAKLPGRPLLEAMLARKAAVPADSWAYRRVRRLARAVDKDREHTAPVKDLLRVAKVAGIDPATVWGAKELAHAREHQDERVEARVRGWDLTLDAPKSVSVLWALADAGTAARIQHAYLAAVRETMTTVEQWCAHGQRGEHGRGRTARRVATQGLTGTLTLHTTARPVGGSADPHLHAHVMIANLAKGVDGQWGGVAAGGRELYTAVPAIGGLMRARLREHLTRELGVRWVEEAPGRWEIAGIGAPVRDVYSRRRDQAVAAAGKGSTPAQRRLAARRSAAAKLSGAKTDGQRTEWADRAREADHDPAKLVADAIGRGLVEAEADRPRRTPEPSPGPGAADLARVRSARADQAAVRVWSKRPTKPVSHAHLIAAAADTAPTGMGATEAAAIADTLAARSAPAGGTAGGAHLRHAQRYAPPQLTPAQARAGQGPAARAAKHTVAQLQARREVARAREQAARARLSELSDLEGAGRVALWRAGTTREQVSADQAAASGELSAAISDAARIEERIRTVRKTAATIDAGMATAQESARETLRQTQQHAQKRAALASMRRSAVSPPIPRTPKKEAGPGMAPTPRPWRYREPEGPRGGEGPSL